MRTSTSSSFQLQSTETVLELTWSVSLKNASEGTDFLADSTLVKLLHCNLKVEFVYT